MAVSFNVAEILQIAIRIEENGEEFYRLMAQKLRKQDIKDTFNALAEAEIKHREVFENMLNLADRFEPPESYPGEYYAYLKAYADGYIFTKKKKGQLMAKKIKTAKEALKFALGVEIDSILYYLEVRKLVPEGQKKVIDTIIEEEKRHYLRLSGIMKKS